MTHRVLPLFPPIRRRALRPSLAKTSRRPSAVRPSDDVVVGASVGVAPSVGRLHAPSAVRPIVRAGIASAVANVYPASRLSSRQSSVRRCVSPSTRGW